MGLDGQTGPTGPDGTGPTGPTGPTGAAGPDCFKCITFEGVTDPSSTNIWYNNPNLTNAWALSVNPGDFVGIPSTVEVMKTILCGLRRDLTCYASNVKVISTSSNRSNSLQLRCQVPPGLEIQLGSGIIPLVRGKFREPSTHLHQSRAISAVSTHLMWSLCRITFKVAISTC